MNFGSEFALHDSDDEEEEVREDAPAGPLSSMSSGPTIPLPGAGGPVNMHMPPPPPPPPPGAMFYTPYNDGAPQQPPRGEAEKTVRWTDTTQSPLPHGEHWPMLREKLSLAWNRRTPARRGAGGGGGGGGGGRGVAAARAVAGQTSARAVVEAAVERRAQPAAAAAGTPPTTDPNLAQQQLIDRRALIQAGILRADVPTDGPNTLTPGVPIANNNKGRETNGFFMCPPPPDQTVRRDPHPTPSPFNPDHPGYLEMVRNLGIPKDEPVARGAAGDGGIGGGGDGAGYPSPLDDGEDVPLPIPRPAGRMLGNGVGVGTGTGAGNGLIQNTKGGRGGGGGAGGGGGGRGGGGGGGDPPLPWPHGQQRGPEAPPVTRLERANAEGGTDAAPPRGHLGNPQEILSRRFQPQLRAAAERRQLPLPPQQRWPAQLPDPRLQDVLRGELRGVGGEGGGGAGGYVQGWGPPPPPPPYGAGGFAQGYAPPPPPQLPGAAGGYVPGWVPPPPPQLPPGQQPPGGLAAVVAAAEAATAAAAAAATATATAAGGVGGRRSAAAAATVATPRSRTWTRKVDTNILNVDMAALGNAAPYATGDPTICSGCRACLSAVSILAPVPNKPTTAAATSTAAAATAAAAERQSALAGKEGASLKLSPSPRPPAAAAAVGAAEVGGKSAKADATAVAKAGATAEGDAFVEGAYDWTCEYCGEVNRLELDDMEKPVKGQDSVDYVLEMAPIANAVAHGKGGGDDKDESAVLFVIDTSGSMCVTTAVEGRLTLRGDRTKDMSRLLASGDDRNQLMPGQKGGMTYVSRLQSMQAAIDAQLQTMAKDTPSRHAGLVTFNAEVSLIGDGSADSRVIAGDRLSDGEALREVGRAYPLSRPVSEARERLADRLFALEEGGPTALGPAVVAGLSMLKERGGRGSRLVLCTDGLANVGLGALDDLKGDEQREAAEHFYDQLGIESVENGVTVDVVSVDSDACDLENLGTMADKSGGTITRVKASELASNFAGILANPILASKVSVRVTLHKGLKFRNADVGSDANTLDRDIGNVTRETELNFEYQVRSKGERQTMGIKYPEVSSSSAAQPASAVSASVPATPTARTAAAASPPPLASPAPPSPWDTNTTSAKVAAPAESPAARGNSGKGPVAAGQGGRVPASAEKGQGGGKAAAAGTVDAAAAAAAATATTTTPAFLPFQVQICYTRPDGMKCMRVLTRTQKVTRSKKVAERSMSMAVVAGHAASQAGSMASKGAYQSTRVSMRAWSNLMSRNSATEKAQEQVKRFGSEMAALDNELLTAQSTEGARPAAAQDEGGAVNDEQESASHGRTRKSARSGNDSLSFQTYRAKTHSSKGYH